MQVRILARGLGEHSNHPGACLLQRRVLDVFPDHYRPILALPLLNLPDRPQTTSLHPQHSHLPFLRLSILLPGTTAVAVTWLFRRLSLPLKLDLNCQIRPRFHLPGREPLLHPQARTWPPLLRLRPPRLKVGVGAAVEEFPETKLSPHLYLIRL